MDYTIELWSMGDMHHGECTCGRWHFTSKNIDLLEEYAEKHQLEHKLNGDLTEIV